jgi:hypothetical protein
MRMRITKRLENGEVVAVSVHATEDDFQEGIDLGPGVTGQMHLFRHCDEFRYGISASGNCGTDRLCRPYRKVHALINDVIHRIYGGQDKNVTI